ncbi:MAG: hypothetical protein KDM91_18590 [Verrucomicrobiae bacterium]|nr:hypothetical protein [Verrucomicrobiae bacterium]MCP5541532.1 hypothetical protein [Akkermansiaceae bacterium]MCP5551482.1 hypothetical protein [Akkermansiaceae bacterium]
MFWLRLVWYSLPLGVAAAAVWLTLQAREFEYRADSDLVLLIPERPAAFNPLAPSEGAARDVTELIYDRMMRRDDELILRPNLLKSLEYRRRTTFYFTGEKEAEKAAAKIESSKTEWAAWGLADAVREGALIHISQTLPQPEAPDRVAEGFDPKGLAKLLRVRLTLKGAVKPSLQSFLGGSIEKGQIQHTRYDGDRVADLFLLGDTDLFLKEFELYYRSNPNLEPLIEVAETTSRISTLEMTLELRDDVVWHDGEAFTADDVLFTYEEVTRPAAMSPLKEGFASIARLEKAGEYTLRADCREYYAPMAEAWEALAPLPEHRLKTAVSPADWAAFFAAPVGTGPFALDPEASAASGKDELVLRPNEAYFRGKPLQPRLRYRVIADPERRLLASRLGNIDGCLPLGREPLPDLGPAFVAASDVARYHTFVAWNLDRELFQDSRARQALAWLADVPKVLADAASGPEPLAGCRGLFFPDSHFCQAVLPAIPHDREAAERALTDAGWKRRGGAWQYPEGKAAAFRLAYDRANRQHSRLAEALAAHWREAGIDVALEGLDWAQLIEKRLAPREFDAALLEWELGFGRDQFAVWHSSRAGPGGANFSGLRNAVVDDLLVKLRATEVEDEIRRHAEALQAQIHELQPCLFLCETGGAMLFRADAVKQSRPKTAGARSFDAVSTGRAGLYAGRPWWVRDTAETRRLLEEETAPAALAAPPNS